MAPGRAAAAAAVATIKRPRGSKTATAAKKGKQGKASPAASSSSRSSRINALPRTPPKKAKATTATAAANKRKRKPNKAKPKGKEDKNTACPICLEAFDAIPAHTKRSGLRSAGRVEVAACGHAFDKPCLAQYCSVALGENKGVETAGALPCPVPGCGDKGKGVLTPAEVRALVGHAAWETHKARRAAHQIETSTQLRYCPRVKCATVNRIPVDSKGAVPCKKCKKTFCAGCGLAAHPRKTCEEASDALYGKWKGKHKVQPCPKCGRHIEKDGGCSHMTCLKCKADWCWSCAKLLGTGPEDCSCYRHMVQWW